MTARRITEKPALNPDEVRELPADHEALRENRTLFPSTVVEVTADEPERLLISGKNNRKLGETVAKGRFKGYGIYGFSLEERATCPEDCEVRPICYGNGMHLARRHKIGDPDVFYDRMGLEICELLDKHPGLLIRLHVLGDFPDVDYVAFWKEILDEHPNVAIYGYTHRFTTSWGGNRIGDEIEALKEEHPERFRIRWSSPVSRPDSTVVIDEVPEAPSSPLGTVCPSQTDATACCATCGLCWEKTGDTILFIKHGPTHAGERNRKIAKAIKSDDDVRKVAAIPAPDKLVPMKLAVNAPQTRQVAPELLLIEAAYQRDLSPRSVRFIHHLVEDWDWTKFKPPIVAETDGGLFIVDGQHTAIAAATHPQIDRIPVLVVAAAFIEERADAFVAHNRDRLTMTPAQIFYAEVAAGVTETVQMLDTVERAGATIPRTAVPKRHSEPGQITALADLRRCYRQDPDLLERILVIAVTSKIAPIAQTTLRALRILLTDDLFKDVARQSDGDIAAALRSIEDFDKSARRYAAKTEQSRFDAGALLIAQKAKAWSRDMVSA